MCASVCVTVSFVMCCPACFVLESLENEMVHLKRLSIQYIFLTIWHGGVCEGVCLCSWLKGGVVMGVAYLKKGA